MFSGLSWICVPFVAWVCCVLGYLYLLVVVLGIDFLCGFRYFGV